MNIPVDRRNFVAAVTSGIGVLARTAPASTAIHPLPPDSGLFKGFKTRWVRTNGADIFLRLGGEGPTLLLLHGYPQTMTCWHKVASSLTKRFQVVAADLRGYGDSVGPADGGEGHIDYSFRAMAHDQVNVMSALGHDRFYVAGHDRGARTAHRMALDHPERDRKGNATYFLSRLSLTPWEGLRAVPNLSRIGRTLFLRGYSLACPIA